jgi:hypothetical protein
MFSSYFRGRPTKTHMAQKSSKTAGRWHSQNRYKRLEVESLEARELMSVTPLNTAAVQAAFASHAAVIGPIAPAASVAPLPKVVLTEVTTPNASSVTVDYSISGANVTSPLGFSVYRSDKPTLDASSTLIGSQTINPSTDPGDLKVGAHAVTLLNGTNLPPNQALPYVVVVANPNGSVREAAGSVNAAYFRTFELGVLAHGGGTGIEAVQNTSASENYFESDFAAELKAVDHYDDVIAYNWEDLDYIPAPGLAVEAGDRLYQQVVARADQLAAGHKGDVVDLHFISHSRGAVVTSQAMQDLLGTTDPALQGSYIKATFLDPHPANAATTNLLDTYLPMNGLIMGHHSQILSAMNDPVFVVIPSNVKEAEVYWEHTDQSHMTLFHPVVDALAKTFYQPWGAGPSDGVIVNESSVPIQWHDLTNRFDPTYLHGTEIGGIGHYEIALYYEAHIIDQGLAAA